MGKPHITQERLRYLLNYDPDTGKFTWLHPTSNRVAAGRQAGNLDSLGYIQISLDGRDYRGHRLAWLYMTGKIPEAEVDHVNRDRSDNRWANLRVATREENARNRVAYKNNKTGLKGVSRKGSRYSAKIWMDGASRLIGWFDTPEEAHDAFRVASNENFGEFARAA